VTITYIILGFLMLASIITGMYWTFTNYRQYKNNLVIAAELDRLLKSTLSIVKKNKELSQREKEQTLSSLYDAQNAQTMDLESPAILSTLLTVLVNKFGDIKLSVKDFMIPDEEYISVYVDPATQELLLSTNHGHDQDKAYPMVNFADPDDNTFH